MRPDYFDTIPLERPTFFALKDTNPDALCPYVSCVSGPSVSQWKYTADVKSAKRFDSHHHVLWFVSEANADVCMSRDFNGKKKFEIVKIAEVEVVTTEWKEVP